MSKSYMVTAQWDAEAGVWVATSEDIVGLVTEAKSLDTLYARVLEIAPELLDENGISVEAHGAIDFHVLSSFDLSAAE
jgi:predicted RNase H-like HicB family nuclease